MWYEAKTYWRYDEQNIRTLIVTEGQHAYSIGNTHLPVSNFFKEPPGLQDEVLQWYPGKQRHRGHIGYGCCHHQPVSRSVIEFLKAHKWRKSLQNHKHRHTQTCKLEHLVQDKLDCPSRRHPDLVSLREYSPEITRLSERRVRCIYYSHSQSAYWLLLWTLDTAYCLHCTSSLIHVYCHKHEEVTHLFLWRLQKNLLENEIEERWRICKYTLTDHVDRNIYTCTHFQISSYQISQSCGSRSMHRIIEIQVRSCS